MPEILKALKENAAQSAAGISSYNKNILGAVVIAWLVVIPLIVIAGAVSGFDLASKLVTWEAALTTLATGIVGALLKDMVSPTRQHEQEVAKLEAAATLATAAPSVAAKAVEETPPVNIKPVAAESVLTTPPPVVEAQTGQAT